MTDRKPRPSTAGRPVHYTLSPTDGVLSVPVPATVKVRFSTDLPVDLLNATTAFCRDRKVTKTAVVEAALREYLVRESSGD